VIKRLCAAGAVLAGAALLAVPAHADTWSDIWSDNWSSNSDAIQTGNNFGDVFTTNRGGWASTNVNNVNGIAPTATNGGITVTYIFN
jgi:hypothetical protein